MNRQGRATTVIIPSRRPGRTETVPASREVAMMVGNPEMVVVTVPAVREALEMMVAMKGITAPEMEMAREVAMTGITAPEMEMAREVAMKMGNPEMVVVTAMATRETSRIRK